jgi:hypothetical protein
VRAFRGTTDVGHGYHAIENPIGGAIEDAAFSKRIGDLDPTIGGAYHKALFALAVVHLALSRIACGLMVVSRRSIIRRQPR